MPPTEVRAFRDEDGHVPFQTWVDELERRAPKAYAKCLARLIELAERGYEMRRPYADFLRDGIYELRASLAGIHYRVLYFFAGENAVVLSHGIIKQDRVPTKEIERAMDRMRLVLRSPDRYTADFEL